MRSMGQFRVGTVFHETFPLSRPAIESVLRAVCSWHGQGSLFEHLRANTKLGTRYCKAMPRYGQASGLLDQNYALTAFGKQALANDPNLSRPVTQWLMHYHLSAPHGPGPLFWHALVTRTLRPGRTLRSSEVAQQLAEILREMGQKEPTSRALQSTATVFMGSYARSDGLKALRVLEECGDGSYEVLHPEPPPLWMLAYTLADFWKHHWGEQVTVNLSELNKPGGWASLFWMDAGTMEQQLQQLKQEGIIDLYRVAPPYQVVRLWGEQHDFLERAYAGAGSELA